MISIAPGDKGIERSLRRLPTKKDEFLGIKNTIRNDVLAAHRVPPQLIGVIPTNPGGFGDPGKAIDQIFQLEMLPLQAAFLEIRDWLALKAVKFVPRQKGE